MDGLKFLSLSFFLLAASGCQQGSDLALEGKSEAEVQLIQRGKAVYVTHCTACHNSNPKENGAVGPALAGSSLELITGRVLTGKYPAGYTPKHVAGGGQIQMPIMPYLEKELPALNAYLNALK